LQKKETTRTASTHAADTIGIAAAPTRPTASEESLPVEPEKIVTAPNTTLTPQTTQAEVVIDLAPKKTKAEFRIGDNLEAILRISKKHDSLSIDPAQLSQSEALSFQLQNTQRGTEEASYLALEDAYALSISQSISDAIDQAIQSKQTLYREQSLTSYAALEWQRLQSLLEQRSQSDNEFEALQTSDRAMQSMEAFEQSAEQTLAALAQRYAMNGDLQTARSTYYKLLILNPSDPTAIKFLHHHADAAGSAKTFAATGIKMRFIPAGEFTMGTTEVEFQRDADETQHQVSLRESFYLSETEVTQAQWMQVMGGLPEQFPAPYDAANAQLPIHSVAWAEALAYCNRLSELDPEGSYRLPTEAEWEYACRAGSTTPYNTQSDRLSTDDANIFDPASLKSNESIVAVSSYQANAWGLYDMHGNVWEWTSDWKLEYEALPSVDPSAPVLPGGADETLSTKVLRGGSYYDEAGFARSGNRWNYAPSIATEYIGFRVVRDVQF
jgi:formylglycine-generating enzyme required for sulfatase activity